MGQLRGPWCKTIPHVATGVCCEIHACLQDGERQQMDTYVTSCSMAQNYVVCWWMWPFPYKFGEPEMSLQLWSTWSTPSFMSTPKDGVVSILKKPKFVIKCHAYQKGSIVHALQGMPCASLSLLHGGLVQVGQRLDQVVQPLCHGKNSTRLSFPKFQNVSVYYFILFYFGASFL